ncbi:hypothetical protein PUN28_020522 [Cardiocondyla obscurior]|uniref:Uncharacterized protein n=1 Tax=Cardiocondyla obscurior TaxID=286306 RepID=A0AAW2E8H4_9HYME
MSRLGIPVAKSNTRLGDLATPPADSSESSRKQHEARDFATCRPTAQRARESNTRSGTLPLAGRQPQRAREQHEARGPATAGRQLRFGSNTRLGDFATRRPTAQESSKATRGSGTCHSAADSSESSRATQGFATCQLTASESSEESNTRLGDFATAADSSEPGATRGLGLATPPADSSERARESNEARGLCHSASRQLESSRKQHEVDCKLPADSPGDRESNTRLGTLPLRRPTAQRARESNTRLGTLPPAADTREFEKATRGSGTLPLRRPTV